MLICVTNRKLCQDDFLERINKLAQGKPYAIMLREKDLSSKEYHALAKSVQEICTTHQVWLIINQNIDIAAQIGCPNIHLSMADLQHNQDKLSQFEQVGASVHSLDDAIKAQQLGATYLIAGHIFATECKRGLAPRGLDFLESICDSVDIPVFAIGGITRDNAQAVIETGASGICVMSEAMTTSSPSSLAVSFSSNGCNFS